MSKRLFAVLAALMLVLTMAVPALAERTSKDGLTVTVVPTETSYEVGETIEVTLTVENTNDEAVPGVTLRNEIPTGYRLESGSQNVKSVGSLAADGVATLTSRYVKAPVVSVPTTGDNTPIALLCVLMVAGLTGALLLGRRFRRFGVFGLVLVLALGAFGGLTEAQAASKSIHLSTSTTVGGARVNLKSVVTYETEEGTVHGYVTDAMTGNKLSGVTLAFYNGHNNPGTTGSTVATATTNSNGYYIAKMPVGEFTAVMSKAGYANGHMNVESVVNPTRDYNGVLTPLQAEGNYRIVLTWNANPRDLDSHLSATMNDGTTRHVYWSNKSASYGGRDLAKLDLDDITSYGPETTTIYQPEAGTFRFSVHDYTNRSSSTTSAMAASGAKVVVFRGNTQVATYNVPNRPGTLWTLFEIRNGELVNINTMSFHSSPSSIRSGNRSISDAYGTYLDEK